MIYDVYLSLGSNLGNREENLLEAVSAITNISQTQLIKTSKIYETEPVGYTQQEKFLNMAIWIKTSLNPEEILTHIQEVEKVLKRTRTIRWGPRTIDIDILLYGNLEINRPELTIPHPRMYERSFVLIPLKDIYPSDKIDERDITTLIKQCGGWTGITLFSCENSNKNSLNN